eukprot:COSAG02_NODE_131_length_34710_cov_17.171159_44_plen_229_part_00
MDGPRPPTEAPPGETQSSVLAMETYLLEVSQHGAPTPDLPSSREGKPKPAPPWIAAALYWVASNPILQPLTGVSVSEPKLGPPAEPCMFKIVSLGDNGAAIARLLREIMSLAGSGLKLPGWDAVRKHLSPGWWENPTRGGNRGGDFSQTYVERVPFTFAVRSLFPVPCFLFPVSCSLLPAPCSPFPRLPRSLEGLNLCPTKLDLPSCLPPQRPTRSRAHISTGSRSTA